MSAVFSAVCMCNFILDFFFFYDDVANRSRKW